MKHTPGLTGSSLISTSQADTPEPSSNELNKLLGVMRLYAANRPVDKATQQEAKRILAAVNQHQDTVSDPQKKRLMMALQLDAKGLNISERLAESTREPARPRQASASSSKAEKVPPPIAPKPKLKESSQSVSEPKARTPSVKELREAFEKKTAPPLAPKPVIAPKPAQAQNAQQVTHPRERPAPAPKPQAAAQAPQLKEPAKVKSSQSKESEAEKKTESKKLNRFTRGQAIRKKSPESRRTNNAPNRAESRESSQGQNLSVRATALPPRSRQGDDVPPPVPPRNESLARSQALADAERGSAGKSIHKVTEQEAQELGWQLFDTLHDVKLANFAGKNSLTNIDEEIKKTSTAGFSRFANVKSRAITNVSTAYKQLSAPLHANFINVSNKFMSRPQAIACQAPFKHQLTAQFEMLYESKATCLAVLHSNADTSKRGLSDYFCSKGVFGDFVVNSVRQRTESLGMVQNPQNSKEQIELKAAVYELSIKRHGEAPVTVPVVHVENWPDHRALPADTLKQLAQLTNGLVEAKKQQYNKVNARLQLDPHKLLPVVHCTAGVGRTGSLLAAMEIEKFAQAQGAPVTQLLSLEEMVINMRLSRDVQMVQTAEQMVSLAALANERGVAINRPS